MLMKFNGICYASVAAALVFAGTPKSAEAYSLFSVPLFSHPNGNASADTNSVDSKDYGLRLDNGKLQTFHFLDVQMEFFDPAGPITPDTEFAKITGTIAHLQSSNGGATAYSGSSGFDATDQLWSITAVFKQIDGQGSALGSATLPSADMLQQLIDAGISNNAITFGALQLTLTPLFNEGMQAAIYNGPRSFTGKSPGGGADPFNLQFRHRLDSNVFAGAQWDVVTGNGWLMGPDGGNGYTRDFLFYTTGVPEPATAVMAAIGALTLIRRKRGLLAVR